MPHNHLEWSFVLKVLSWIGKDTNIVKFLVWQLNDYEVHTNTHFTLKWSHIQEHCIWKPMKWPQLILVVTTRSTGCVRLASLGLSCCVNSGEPLIKAKRTITHRPRSNVMHLGPPLSDPLHKQGTMGADPGVPLEWRQSYLNAPGGMTGVDPVKLKKRTHNVLTCWKLGVILLFFLLTHTSD